jgi:hypothetical protein
VRVRKYDHLHGARQIVDIAGVTAQAEVKLPF